jgi:hypothetical protein
MRLARLLRTTILAAASAVHASMLGGCQTDPEIRVESVDLVTRGEQADEYSIQLELFNPSYESLVLDSWQYEFACDAGDWSTEWIASRTLPPRSYSKDSLPVVVRHDGASPTLVSWRVSGTLRYLLPGRLAETLFDLGVSRPSVDFAGTGSATSVGPEAKAVEGR